MSILGDMVGTKMEKCGHPMTGSGVHLILKDELEDWTWATEKYNLEADVTSLMVCWDCYEQAPSILARGNERKAKSVAMAEKQETEQATKIAEAREAGIPLFQCPDCDKVLEEEELVPVRHCTHCESTFDASDGRNCGTCNRPFTTKITLKGCPDCLDEDNECHPYEGK